MTTTRFAPGMTGHAHAGTVANALFNWLVARKSGGKFVIRWDGGNAGKVCQEYRDSIKRDLEAFGLHWDAEWHFPDHQDEIADRFREWVRDKPEAYICDCTAEDIQQRDGPDMRRIDRLEKYPPLDYAISSVVGYFNNRNKKVLPIKAVATSTAKGEILTADGPISEDWSIENVLDETDSCWRPWSTGRQRHDRPRMRVVFPCAVHRVDVLIPEGFCVFCFYDPAVDCERPPYIENNIEAFRDTPQSVILEFKRPRPSFHRQYTYDGHCWEKDQKRRLESPIEAHLGPFNGRGNLVRINVDGCFPTAVSIDGYPDLAWWSPIIDQDLGVTDVWRGTDLEPFHRLEAATCELIGYHPNRVYHPLIVDKDTVKFSKHVGSPRLMGSETSQRLLGTLAWKLGIVASPYSCSADDLLEQFDPHRDPCAAGSLAAWI